MTHDARSTGSASALAVLVAWARLRFRRRHDQTAVSATADAGEANDCAANISITNDMGFREPTKALC